MAIWYEPLEVSEYGKGIGRWRMTARSDEDNFPPRGLCSCADGHESPESARQCPEALAELERYFPRPADGAKRRPPPCRSSSARARTSLRRAGAPARSTCPMSDHDQREHRSYPSAMDLARAILGLADPAGRGTVPPLRVAPLCMEDSPSGLYRCTLDAGHASQHEVRDFDGNTVERWPAERSPSSAPLTATSCSLPALRQRGYQRRPDPMSKPIYCPCGLWGLHAPGHLHLIGGAR